MALFCYLRIFSEDAIPAQTHYTKEGLAEDATRHLGHSFAAVDEDYWYFLNIEANLVGRKLYLYFDVAFFVYFPLLSA